MRYHPNGDISKGKAKTIYALFLEKYLDGARYGKARYLWCRGDGTNVRIWTDEWLPREHLCIPYTPKGASLLSWVSELIIPITGSWDEELIRDTFLDEDADLIPSIPVHDGMYDILAWHYNKNGLFTVKSAYKVHFEYTGSCPCVATDVKIQTRLNF